MIKLKDILKEITHAVGAEAGSFAWSQALNIKIDKKWEQWRIDSMKDYNLQGWIKLRDLITVEENDIDRDNKGLFRGGTPGKEPEYGLEIHKSMDYIYQQDYWVHNKKRTFEK